MRFSHVFFDLDGTLTDSAEGILNSVDYALAHFGIAMQREKLLSFIGPPLLQSFLPLLGNDMNMARAAVAKYREYFSETGIYENRVYDGIDAMLRAASEAGLLLCLATSKPEPFALRIMRHFRLEAFFTVMAGAELQGPRNDKADVLRHAHALAGRPAPACCLMVGDRKHDVEGAKSLGMPCCGVLYGYGSEEELRLAGADFLAHSVADVQHLLLQS